ncbi:MAG: PIN domain-containing protein [Thiobacillus sp.]|nr:PIN domain-containing protein [Thiobacillus sp.]
MADEMVLDTNVLSELMRPQPAAQVMAWFDGRAETTFFITAITRAEILLGIGLLPAGHRRDTLAEAASRMFEQDFGGRCLPFDEHPAGMYARVVAERTRGGLPISTEDAEIAAISLLHGLPLVTRNVKDFDNITGLRVVNPWELSEL